MSNGFKVFIKYYKISTLPFESDSFSILNQLFYIHVIKNIL